MRGASNRDLKNERQDIDKNRGRLTMVMQTTQIIYTNLLIENDRVTRFNGDLVTSSAINGAAMQYQKADLAIIISNALDKATDDIANAKYTVITDEKRKLEIKKVISFFVAIFALIFPHGFSATPLF